MRSRLLVHALVAATMMLLLSSARAEGPAPPKNVLVNDPARDTFPNNAQKEPTIAVFGSNIVVGWNDEGVQLGKTVRGISTGVGYGFSTDGGATFKHAGELGTSHWGADPSVAVDRAGNFYFGRIDFEPGSRRLDRIAVFKSTDGGATFPQSTSVSHGLSGINDKPLITVDNTGDPFDGSVYASWTNAVDNVLNIVFARSTDGGASFSNSIPLSNSNLNQASMTAVGPGRELYVVWMEAGANIYVRKSIDGGATFAPAVLVASVNPIGFLESSTAQFCGRILKGSITATNCPIIAVDKSGGPTNGRVYVVFSSDPDDSGPDFSDVYLTSSNDGGQTWSAPLPLNDDATTNDQWMPFVVVAPNGEVAAMWYDRRLDPENLLFDVFMTISVDGGASFGPNFRITEVSSPPPGIKYNLGFPPYRCYMGSYNYMVADATNFYLVWTDNRMVNSGLVDPNIFFAKVPIELGPPAIVTRPRRRP